MHDKVDIVVAMLKSDFTLGNTFLLPQSKVAWAEALGFAGGKLVARIE